MTATPYSTLASDSVLRQHTRVIEVAHSKPDHMSAERQRLLAEAAWWALEELERTRDLLSRIAPDLVVMYA